MALLGPAAETALVASYTIVSEVGRLAKVGAPILGQVGLG